MCFPEIIYRGKKKSLEKLGRFLAIKVSRVKINNANNNTFVRLGFPYIPEIFVCRFSITQVIVACTQDLTLDKLRYLVLAV